MLEIIVVDCRYIIDWIVLKSCHRSDGKKWKEIWK